MPSTTTNQKLGDARITILRLNTTGPVDALPVVALDSTGGIGNFAGTSQVSVRNFQTSSGALLEDSTERAVRVNVVAGAAGGSTQISVRNFQTSSGATLEDSTDRTLRVSVIAGGSTQVSIRNAQTSSGALIEDSTERAWRVNVVAGAAGGSTQMSVRNFQTSSGALIEDSTERAIRVNVIASTVVSGSTLITVRQSTVGDLRATVYQSTFTDLNVRINAPSTGNSSNYLPVRLTDSSNFISPALDYVHDSSITASTLQGPIGMFRATSTRPPALSTSDKISAGISDLYGRQMVAVASVFPTASYGSYAASTAGQASTTVINTSNAVTKTYVYAYSITSTVAGPVTCGFRNDSAASLLWPVHLAAPSGAMAGANLSVTPPAYLFANSTGGNLTFAVSSTGVFHVGVAYFTE